MTAAGKYPTHPPTDSKVIGSLRIFGVPPKKSVSAPAAQHYT
jgi:hypothetical protein